MGFLNINASSSWQFLSAAHTRSAGFGSLHCCLTSLVRWRGGLAEMRQQEAEGLLVVQGNLWQCQDWMGQEARLDGALSTWSSRRGWNQMMPLPTPTLPSFHDKETLSCSHMKHKWIIPLKKTKTLAEGLQRWPHKPCASGPPWSITCECSNWSLTFNPGTTASGEIAAFIWTWKMLFSPSLCALGSLT